MALKKIYRRKNNRHFKNRNSRKVFELSKFIVWENIDVSIEDPVYTGPRKFLNGRIFNACNRFTRNRANSVKESWAVSLHESDLSLASKLSRRLLPRKRCKNLHGSFVYTISRQWNRTGQKFHRSLISSCSLCRSKTSTVPWVPCKQRADPCKFSSVQKFVHTSVHGVKGSNHVYFEIHVLKFLGS